MIQVNNIYVFITVVESGGFSEAARKLNITPTAVSKNIKQLESELGITLFHRSTRKVILTDNAKLLYQKAKNVLAGVDEIKNYANVLQKVAIGTLNISAPVAIAEQYLLPYMNDYLSLVPQLSLGIELADHKHINFANDEIDILFGRTMEAVKGQEDDVIGTQLFVTRNILCVADSYVKKYGEPKQLTDLNEHFYVHHTYAKRCDRFLDDIAQHGIKMKNKLTVNTTFAVLQCILSGIGIGVIPEYMIRDELAEKKLIALDSVYSSEPIPLFMFYRKTNYQDHKILQFKEYILNIIRKTRCD